MVCKDIIIVMSSSEKRIVTTWNIMKNSFSLQLALFNDTTFFCVSPNQMSLLKQ